MRSPWPTRWATPSCSTRHCFEPVYSDSDVMAMGARLSAYTATLESGPLAVVGTDPALEVAFRRFTNVSPSQRPAALFRTEAGARAWLAEKSDARMTPPQGPAQPKAPQARRRKRQSDAGEVARQALSHIAR